MRLFVLIVLVLAACVWGISYMNEHHPEQMPFVQPMEQLRQDVQQPARVKTFVQQLNQQRGQQVDDALKQQ